MTHKSENAFTILPFDDKTIGIKNQIGKLMSESIVINNDLIRSTFYLSVPELKLIYTALSKIDNSVPLEPRTSIYITKNDWIKLGVDPKNVVREARTACENLFERELNINIHSSLELKTRWVHNIILLKTDDFNELKQFDIDLIKERLSSEYSPKVPMILESIETMQNSDENIIARIVFHDDVLFFLSAMQKHFTKIEIEDLRHLSTFYSHRVFHLLMQFKSTGYLKISLKELRELLLIGEKYQENKDLKKWVISPIVADINKKTRYNLTYKLIKVGNKYSYIEFIFNTEQLEKKEKKTSVYCKLTDAQINKYSTILSKLSDISDLSNFTDYPTFALWIAGILRDPKSVREETATRIFKALRKHTDFASSAK